MNKVSVKFLLLLSAFLITISQSYALENSLPPSGNFELKNWKLTLPISKAILLDGENVTTSPAEIFSSDTTQLIKGQLPLNHGFRLANIKYNGDLNGDYDYFYTASDGAMVFQVPHISTAIVSKPRTLLRETLGNDDNFKWMIDGGTHRLSGRCKVADFPTNVAEPKLLFAQVETTDGAPLVKLLWEGVNKSIKAVVNASADGNGVSYGLDAVVGNSTFDFSLDIKGTTLTITIDDKSTKVSLGSAWNSAKFRFNAGAYPQISSSDGFKVQYYALSVSHTAAPIASDFYNLDDWKLFLPIERWQYYKDYRLPDNPVEITSTCNPKEQSTAYLNRGYKLKAYTYEGAARDYFYLAENKTLALGRPSANADNGLALEDQGTELREAQCNSNYYWKADQSHTLEASYTIPIYPKNVEIPKLVFTQIGASSNGTSDNTRSLLKMQWEGQDKPIKVIVNLGSDSNEGSKIYYIDHNNQKTLKSFVLSVQQTRVYIKIDENSRIYDANGKVFEFLEIPANWKGFFFYFKTGCYPQIPGTFELRFHQLKVRHEDYSDSSFFHIGDSIVIVL